MEKFIEDLKLNVDALEDVQLTPETDLLLLPEWDSLALLSTMAMVASEYGVNLESSAILSAATVQELYDMVQSKL